MQHLGYFGKILRVDLSSGEAATETITDSSIFRKLVGGVGLGIDYLYKEVRPSTNWDDPDNIIGVFPGPFAFGPVPGSGTVSFVTKGAMTGLAGSTQANGFFGSYLKSNGFDGIIIKGQAKQWQVLVIQNGTARLEDGREYLGLDTFATDDAMCANFDFGKSSVYAIGPAGERQVRFSAVVCDKGHVAAHNGIGAVFGAKKLKAIGVEQGNLKPQYADVDALKKCSKGMMKYAKTFDGGNRAKWGTAGGVENLHRSGQLPIKNYTTSVWEPYANFTGQRMRTVFNHRTKPCWACGLHCKTVEVTEGPYKGMVAEEPEYEAVAAFGPLIGNEDLGAAVMLTDLTDRLGLDINETGWVVAWFIECCERGLISDDFTAGFTVKWGEVETIAELIKRIANRDGFADTLAEGVMRAGRLIGGAAQDCGVYTLKGASPRGHDHRGRWEELLDTCVSNTGTVEATGGKIDVTQHGLEPLKNRFSAEEVSTLNARMNGRRIFEDCVSICRFVAEEFSLLVQAVNAATGWDMTEEEALTVGKRTVNYLRAFNLLHGLDIAKEYPSARYGSAPGDGPAEGVSIIPEFEHMRSNYWEKMGWSRKDGRPLPETLKELGLDQLIDRLW